MNNLRQRLMLTFFRFQKLKIRTMLPDVSQSNYILLEALVMTEKTQPHGLTVSDLARHMHVSPPSISRTIKHLEECGWASRSVCENDRRNSYIQVTEAGRAVYKQSTGIINDFTDAVHTRFGEENTKKMFDMLDQLYEICEDEIKKRPYCKKET